MAWRQIDDASDQPGVFEVEGAREPAASPAVLNQHEARVSFQLPQCAGRFEKQSEVFYVRLFRQTEQHAIAIRGGKLSAQGRGQGMGLGSKNLPAGEG